MAEYIEREAVRKEIRAAQEKLESNDDIVWEMNQKYFAGLAWAHRLLLDAPAADVAPVVRCSECVLSESCTLEDTFRLVAGIENPFCCVGKRKDGEG